MQTKSRISEKVRFDAKLPKEQKDLFERAASLGGYRTLTEFIISSSQEKAKEIIAQHDTILASKRDREIFFKAILNPGKPNKALMDAAKRYKKAIAGK